MTAREKLKLDHPDWTEEKFDFIFEHHCPDIYGYFKSDISWCQDSRCKECWDQEIPDDVMEAVVEDLKNGVMMTHSLPKIVCISGKAQHGKDTTATTLKNILSGRGHRVLIAHYGDLVKYICKTFFDWDGNKDEAGRAILQRVGTDEIRAQRPSYWVDFLIGIIQMFPDEWDYVLIPDCRFPNEIDSFKAAGFDVTHVRVIRIPFVSPLTPEQQMHQSETALDGVRADVYVLNSSNLFDLNEKIVDEVIPIICKEEE